MPAPCSADFRSEVLNSYMKNGSLRKTAEKSIEPKPHRSGNPPKVRPEHHPFPRKLIEKENGLSLEEICTRFEDEFSVKISATAMHESLKRLGISRKKGCHDPKKNRDITGRTGYFFELIRLAPEQAVFIDENGTCLNMTPPYGRSPKGERAYGARPTAKGTGISMIGALSFRGLLGCVCFGGTLDGTVFTYYIENFLAGLLNPCRTVIMNNASPYKNTYVLDLIENTGGGKFISSSVLSGIESD